MKKILGEIAQSFKRQPVWTLYSLALAPLYYIFVGLAALTIGLICLDRQSMIDFWSENA